MSNEDIAYILFNFSRIIVQITWKWNDKKSFAFSFVSFSIIYFYLP